jgi:hypothetical protein
MFMDFLRRNAFWIFVSLSSLFVWIVRWIPESFVRFYNIVFISWDYYPRVLVRGSMYTIAAIGMVCRLLAVILAMWCIYTIWKTKTSSISTKKLLATSIGLESVYYASLIPSILYLFALGSTHDSVFYSMFGVGYFLQVFFTFPFLLMLAIKFFKTDFDFLQSTNLLKLSFVGYIVALWANSVFHWFGLALTEGISFLWIEPNSLLGWNALILMTLAVIFSILGALNLSKKNRQASTYVGLTLTFVGLHFLIYLVFNVLNGSLISVWLTDIWAIGLLGLGLSIIKSKTIL